MTGRLAPAHEVVEAGLAASGTGGCIVLVTDGSQAEVRFANNTTTTNGVRRVRQVAVIALSARRQGTAVGIASASGDVDVGALVARAEADAADAAPAEDASELITGIVDDDFGQAPPETEPAVLGAVMGDLAGAFTRAKAEKRVLSGFAEHTVGTLYLGSSTGLRRRHVQPTGRIQLVARSADGSASSWAGKGTRDYSDVSLPAMEEEVVRRLGWAARTVELEAGRYDTVLPPDAVADLVCMLGDACDGRAAEDGRSVFSAPGGGTKVGQKLAELPFELRSDPQEPGLQCEPFVGTAYSSSDVSVFDNGMPVSRTAWLDQGRLERLRYHRAGAARSKVEPAAPIDNLVLELPGASARAEELASRVERGLLLTCLWYIREVDPATLLLTGLTRDGVYYVEGGEIVGAVNNFRFNESPVDLLARTVEAGRTERCLSREWNEYFPRTAMPALRVADFNMSSVSPAT